MVQFVLPAQRLHGAMTVELPSGGIIFFADGTSTGGALRLTDDRASFGLAVNGATGTIRRIS
jgi:hypothetical protein